MNELDYITRLFALIAVMGGTCGLFGLLGFIAEWVREFYNGDI
jgi:hypothetical protein